MAPPYTSSQEPLPVVLFSLGLTDLISVIPPGAQLAPTSRIPPTNLGKVPGRKLSTGQWIGYNWRHVAHTAEDVRRWVQESANIGLRADHFSAVDIDVTDVTINRLVQAVALEKLGQAPVRVGNPPKRLLMYRTAEPFGRLRLHIKAQDRTHLVEVLGQGQQYLIHGIHPTTMRPYEWHDDVAAVARAGLTAITRTQVEDFLTALGESLHGLGITTEREGHGRPTAARTRDQKSLLAPSLDELRAAIELLPNTNELFPGRNDYLKMGAAIRAGAGEENEPEALEIFLDWAMRWEGNDHFPGNDPIVAREDWRRLKPPFSVGWPWLAELARAYGYNDAVFDCEAQPAPNHDQDARPVEHSDQWLARRIVEHRGDQLRFSPARGQWLVWGGRRWTPDAMLLAEDLIKYELREVAVQVERSAPEGKAGNRARSFARQLCSASRLRAVQTVLQSEAAIAIETTALDADLWILNTPSGIVDLRTGALRASEPGALCAKITTVGPNFSGPTTEWSRFLTEATGGDLELERYLQRLAGYSLTGSTTEQQLTFIWGSGGNGKTVFLNTLKYVLGDYAMTASMDTFIASRFDRHPTDLAALVGARLVIAGESQEGREWDEQRLKSLSGGDPITARFMRQDFFTYQPLFKLVIAGNHKPAFRNVDPAIRRRLHLVPFLVTPQRVDQDLMEKLRDEAPGILAWMIGGALAWQAQGLTPPAAVLSATQEYFQEQDTVGQMACRGV